MDLSKCVWVQAGNRISLNDSTFEEIATDIQRKIWVIISIQCLSKTNRGKTVLNGFCYKVSSLKNIYTTQLLPTYPRSYFPS